MRRGAGALGLCLLVATAGTALAGGHVLFAARFSKRARLVTNEFAFWNPKNPRSVRSPEWLVSSGSLFSRHGAGWTGIPDAQRPNSRSTNGTGSAVFRVTTRQRRFRNVAVEFELRNLRFRTTRETPAHPWDGVHVLIHYRSQFRLYAVSVNRRDSRVVIKKKLPGGPANGGTYYTIGRPGVYRWTPRRWQRIRVTVRSRGGRVELKAWANGTLLASGVDRGVGGPPVQAGAVGIRGDNDDFEFRNFVVERLE